MRLSKTKKVSDYKSEMDGKRILNNLVGRGNKTSITVSIDSDLLSKVVSVVGKGKSKGKMSQLFEALLKEFLESLEKEKK